MSGFTNTIYGADRISQSIALIGGATAHSYNAVGLQFLPAHSEPPSQLLDPVSVLDALSDSRQKLELTETAAAQIATVESISKFPLSIAQFGASDEQASTLAVNQQPALVNTELLSRYENFESFTDGALPALFGVTETPSTSSAVVDSDEAGDDIFSLSDIVAEAIAQAKASQTEFENTFDGSRQGSVREFVESTGGELGQGIRSGLHDNLAGTPREVLSDLLDLTGLNVLSPVTDPVLATDFYDVSSMLINGFLGSVTQPIGSVAAPQLGPLLINPQDELLNAFA